MSTNHGEIVAKGGCLAQKVVTFFLQTKGVAPACPLALFSQQISSLPMATCNPVSQLLIGTAPAGCLLTGVNEDFIELQ